MLAGTIEVEEQGIIVSLSDQVVDNTISPDAGRGFLVHDTDIRNV